MASVKKITMREYNGTDYDTLYPKTIASQVDGVYTKEESISASTRTALGLVANATPDAALAKIAQQLSEGGNVTIDLLWENASPASAFSAQTISVNTSKYSIFLIEFLDEIKDQSKFRFFIGSKKTSQFTWMYGFNTPDLKLTMFMRQFKAVSNGLEFSDAYKYIPISETRTTNNNCVIITRIFGLQI